MSALLYPKISIVTPCFNAEKTIEQTLQSVIAQGYPNLEYIVIDGASNDATTEIIKAHEKSIAYWSSSKDAGQYDAINKGLAMASGEILCWLNADDMLLPRSLFTVGEIFSQLPQVEWISTLKPGSWDVNGSLAKIDSLPGFNKNAFMDGLFLPTVAKKGYWMQQESSFWRKELWVRAGSHIPNFHLAGDFALWCEFYKHATLYGVDYPLAGFRNMEGQRSEDHLRYLTEAKTALELLRKSQSWHTGIDHQLRYSKLNNLTFLKERIQRHFGYEGQRIVNRNLKAVNPSWKIEGYRFLP